MFIRFSPTKSIVRRSTQILTPAERKKVGVVVLLQIGLGVLDLVGVALIGVLGSLAISGIGSREPGNRVSSALNFLSVENLTLQQQATVIGLLAAGLLIFKTLVSVIFVRRTTFFLSRRGASISSNLISRILAQPLTEIQKKSIQQTQYAITAGVDTITMGILNTSIVLISDVSLLSILSIGLFLVDPVIAVSTVIIFGLVAFALFKLMSEKSRSLGIAQAQLSIETGEKIFEVLQSYRELVVRNRRSYYSREIGDLRLRNANALAERAFMPNTSKYVIEVTLVIGALAMGAFQFAQNDAVRAVATLSVFLAASSRISPAVLRLQQGVITMKGSVGAAQPTLDLIESLKVISPIENVDDRVIIDHLGFSAQISVNNLSMKYPNKTEFAIKDATFSLPNGSVAAVVGPSGAGKTTLIDLILGVLAPDSGSVLIGGYKPSEVISRWPGVIGYVPQDVIIKNGTIRENISMGYPIDQATDELVWNALEIAQLKNFVQTLPSGLDSQVGDRGTKISGGQRQRLGIARAMFTQPGLLVLDEATSALDGETELNITDAVHSLKGRVTVIMIAHRLSTVKQADTLIYLSDGQILSVGSFTQLRESVPDFDKQARLMGL